MWHRGERCHSHCGLIRLGTGRLALEAPRNQHRQCTEAGDWSGWGAARYGKFDSELSGSALA